MILGSASNVLAIHLSKDYTSLDITRFWICSIIFHPTFGSALGTHSREFAYKTLLSFVSTNHCKHRTFICFYFQCTVLVDSRERIWRDPAMYKRSKKVIQEAASDRMFESVDQVSTWPTVLFLLCLIWLWGLDEVTQLLRFIVLVLKPVLGITAMQICCEDITG